MEQIKNKARIAEAFGKYPELHEFLSDLIYDFKHNSAFQVLSSDHVDTYSKLISRIGTGYKILHGQKRADGEWTVYKVKRIIDGAIFESGGSVPTGVIGQMYVPGDMGDDIELRVEILDNAGETLGWTNLADVDQTGFWHDYLFQH